MPTVPPSPDQPEPADGAAILRSLAVVTAERTRRAADPALAARVHALKAWQQTRFRHSHADMLASPRYRDAAQFFLNELYGPADFAQRDAQFARIVPALVRLFPQAIVDTVATLAALHALSEQLDSAMARAGSGAARAPRVTDAIDTPAYVAAWRAVGRPEDRERQIALVMQVGEALDRYTRAPLLLTSLRMMRGPARAAGLHDLQAFLERGLDTFKAMGGAMGFLGPIETREREVIRALFDAQRSAADLMHAGLLPADQG